MKFNEKDLLSQIYEKDPYSVGEYGEYYCANCEKYVKVLDKDLKSKNEIFITGEVYTPTGDILITQDEYKSAYFECEECGKENVISFTKMKSSTRSLAPNNIITRFCSCGNRISIRFYDPNIHSKYEVRSIFHDNEMIFHKFELRYVKCPHCGRDVILSEIDLGEL